MAPATPTRSQYAGVFLLSLSFLLCELILTRIFSVTLWYHFAFMAVSVALLGVAAGGVHVYRRPDPAGAELAPLLSGTARRFSLGMLVALLVLLGVPFIYRISLGALVSLLLIYAAAALPFFFAGALLAIVFRAWPRHVGGLYAADLGGAGAGALLAVPLLNALAAPSALVLAAAVGALASILLGRGAGVATWDRDRRRGGVLAAALALVAVLGQATPLLRLDFSKNLVETDILAEKWNALARITVHRSGTPTWGTSPRWDGPKPPTLWMTIDADAGTPITEWDGNPAKVAALRYDITAFAHHVLPPRGRVLVIGPGGGRDVLTALVMGAREVTGVEINPAIVETVRGAFGDFSGSLYDDPRVRIVVHEGREYLRRTRDHFDLVQASLIDTWAASAAGAYVFSEANLYTRQAFGEYLERLTDDGMLSVSRWHFKDLPIETLRTTALAVRALLDRGVQNPAEHILIVRLTTWDWAYRLNEPRDGIGTILVKRTPFHPDEVARAWQAADSLGFQILYAPGKFSDPTFARLVESRDPEGFARDYPVDVSPPSDERPFFFYSLRLRDLPRWIGAAKLEQGVMQNNVRAVFVLFALLVIVLVLSLAFLVWPLRRRGTPGGDTAPSGPPPGALAYFAAIGLGFILVEIPLIQRLILYLGHPLYALSVVLAGLLIGAGAGSLLSSRLSIARARRGLLVLLALVALAAWLAPAAFGATLGLATGARIALALLGLFVLGLFLGIPFPLGVRLLGDAGARWIPWMWAVNGAFSVLATVLAMALAMSFGFAAPFAAGLFAYVAATFLAFRSLGRPAAA